MNTKIMVHKEVLQAEAVPLLRVELCYIYTLNGQMQEEQSPLIVQKLRSCIYLLLWPCYVICFSIIKGAKQTQSEVLAPLDLGRQTHFIK